MADAWAGGSIGTFTERDVADALTARLGLSPAQRGEFLADLWREYLAQTVFVDDHEPWAAGARQAGIHAVLHRDNAQTISDIEALLAR